MSMVLRNIRRAELIRQLGLAIKSVDHGKSTVIVPFRGRPTTDIVKVEETDRGVFLCPFDAGSPLISIAPFMGSKVHEMSVEEVVESLEKCKSEDVYVQWPTDDPHTVVGRVFAIGSGDELRVFAFPVPKDIDAVNEEVRQICAKKCKSAADGLQCGDCECCGICEVLKDADDEIKRRREGAK